MLRGASRVYLGVVRHGDRKVLLCINNSAQSQHFPLFQQLRHHVKSTELFQEYPGAQYLLNPGYIVSFFVAGMACMTLYAAADAANTTLRKAEELAANDTEEEKQLRAAKSDPRRPPWPLLHMRTVEMREGKMELDDLNLVWEQVKYYYPEDWLIPLEMSQILKYNTAHYLSTYVPDPEYFRIELIEQLQRAQAASKGTTMDTSGKRLSSDVEEIIEVAVEDLNRTSLKEKHKVQLVPKHSI